MAMFTLSILLIATFVTPGVLGSEMLACMKLPDYPFDSVNLTVCKDQEHKIKALEEKVSQLQTIISASNGLESHTTITGVPKDCYEIYRSGVQTDGVYTISPDGRCPFLVYCDMQNGGWTVIQRRVSDTVSFYRNWDTYVAGFGDLSGNHWLGLDKIHRLTQNGYQIFFDMEKYDGTRDFAHYKSFTVHGVSTLYRLNVDAFGFNGSIAELFSHHDNMAFSTYDRDNDKYGANCAETYNGGGWWYKSCYSLGNLNGVYGKKKPGGIDYANSNHFPIKNVMIRVKARFDEC